MQVQLIVADERHSGQVIPVNVPSFMIGRAEGCNLRSRSAHVSRFHCTITVNNGVVSVQDLGGDNGTFVNGNRVSAIQTLEDGDKLVVGTHAFTVAIKAGTEKSEANQDNFFELTPSSIPPGSEQSDPTRPADSDKTMIMKEKPKNSEQAAEVMFEIRLDGQRVSVTKNRLFDLARRGSVLPDDLVTVAGTKVFADSIQGIVFGDKSSAPPAAAPLPTGRPTSAHPASPPVASEADPFAFPDVGNITGESNPFDNIVAEPFVRVGKKESAFSAIWNALDITFSRVYTMEGNNLAIHSLKALYYVVVVVCFLFIFFMWLDVGRKCYEDYEASEAVGSALAVFLDHFVGLAVVTFGCVTIIVVVRILLEMFLLAWLESTRAEQEKDDDEK